MNSPVQDETTQQTVAFVGTGTMGTPMGLQILAAGNDLRVHDRSADAMEELVGAGGTGFESAAAAGDGVDVALRSLPGPPQVLDAVTGSDGLLTAATPPQIVIDLSTNSVDAVRELRQACVDEGVIFIDAPVSGGAARARTGSLAVMVGADETEFNGVVGLLECIGDNVFRVGPSGSGAIAKIINNQLFLAAGVLVQEAYVLGARLGMAPADLHAILSASSAAPYAKLAPLLLGRTFEDVIFRMDIAAKDLALAVESADRADVNVPLTEAARALYDSAVEAGDGGLAFHATLVELERRANVELPPLQRVRRSDNR